MTVWDIYLCVFIALSVEFSQNKGKSIIDTTTRGCQGARYVVKEVGTGERDDEGKNKVSEPNSVI